MSEILIITQGENPKRIDSETLFKSVEDLELAVRPANALKGIAAQRNIDSMKIWHLIQLTEKDLTKFHNFGRRSLQNVKDELSKYGLSLGTQIVLINPVKVESGFLDRMLKWQKGGGAK